MARMRTAKKSSDRNSLKSSLSPITEKETKQLKHLLIYILDRLIESIMINPFDNNCFLLFFQYFLFCFIRLVTSDDNDYDDDDSFSRSL